MIVYIGVSGNGSPLSKAPTLNTTAYSLLGLLTKKDWSAYELTQFVAGSAIRAILPRSRSQLYNEPKKLAALGLIEQSHQVKQGRERTLYKITAHGRTVFQQWLDQPSQTLKIEYKTLLKFYLVQPDDTKALRAKVDEMRNQTIADISEALEQIDHITDEGISFAATAVSASMISQFGARNFKMRLQWLDDVDSALETLPQATDIDNWALARYRDAGDQLRRLLAEQ